MNRIKTGFGLALLALLFTSCATLPKEIKENSTLLIAKIEGYAVGYNMVGDLSISGRFTNGFDITLLDVDTNHHRRVFANRDGFIFCDKLVPEHRYRIDGVQVSRSNSDGTYFEVYMQGINVKEFIPDSEKVINIGKIYVDYDGKAKKASWTIKDYYEVSEYFNNLDPESEWHLADMILY